ncbi:MAG: sigma-70 family RNA polymerase sigma factor [Ilumatobacteraceae bacterium]
MRRTEWTREQVAIVEAITLVGQNSSSSERLRRAALGYRASVGLADMLTSADGVLGELSDAVLIDSVRSGDRGSYAVLYERHGPAARRVARSLVRTDADADDVVSEVFASVLSALENGKGPVGSFVPYLMRSVRNECFRVNRRGRREATGRFDSVDGDAGMAASHDPYGYVDEAATLRAAFDSLPSSQRELLWRTEVDDVTPTKLADGNGSTPHAIAMMAMRARRALASAYLDQHMITEHAPHDLDAECGDARTHLVAYVRGTLGVRRRRRVAAHLERCAHCDEARTGLGRLNKQLRVLPILSLDAGAVGTATIGIRAQFVGWLSAQVAPVAASGMLAVSVLGGPISGRPPTPHAQMSGTAVESSTELVNVPRTTLEGFAPVFGRPGQAVSPGADLGETFGAAATSAALPEQPVSTTPSVDVPMTTSPPVRDAAAPPAFAPPSVTAPVLTIGVGAGPPSVSDELDDPPGQSTNNGNDNGNGGTPPGQSTGNGNGNAGTPPGQSTGNGNGNAGTPPGQLTNNGNGGTPPGQLTNNGNGGTPPGQLTNNGNGNGNDNGTTGATDVPITAVPAD